MNPLDLVKRAILEHRVLAHSADCQSRFAPLSLIPAPPSHEPTEVAGAVVSISIELKAGMVVSFRQIEFRPIDSFADWKLGPTLPGSIPFSKQDAERMRERGVLLPVP